MTPYRAALAAALFMGMAGAAQAQTAAPQSALIQALDACRAISEDARRLACYDAAAGRLAEARTKGEVVVVDKEQVRQARREAFGFNLPSLNILGRLGGGGSAEPEEELSQATYQVKSANEAGGRWTIVMADGSVWRQTENTVGYMRVRSGSKAEVKKGMLGAYFMSIDNYKAIKVERAK
ncbi:hypothetical protein [Phenylobacterium sp.]|jgi:hypothetical protein|uniref:hypothetical protein n=1 Tax=Phenylobacterium sp. TaxID=1871053 RepID=UPI002F95753E